MLGTRFAKSTNEPLNVLLLGAHCDDIEIGCGGTVLELASRYPKLSVHWIVLSSNDERAREAIQEMHRQVGPLRFGRDGLARRGVLVRHLVMPTLVEESEAILEWLAQEVSPDTFVNLMGQYRPAWRVGQPDRRGGTRFPEIDRRPRSRELERARDAGRAAGLWRFDERHRLQLAWG